MIDSETLERLRKAREPKAKAAYRGIPKKSAKTIAKEKAQKEAGTDGVMDLFFASNRSKMTGRCLFCNGDTMKNEDDKFHFSLSHLLPKAIFKSVATHPDVLIELCFYNNSCHTNFDNGIITWEFIKDSKEWEIIKEKLLIVLPAVAPEERKHKLYSKLIELVYETKQLISITQ